MMRLNEGGGRYTDQAKTTLENLGKQVKQRHSKAVLDRIHREFARPMLRQIVAKGEFHVNPREIERHVHDKLLERWISRWTPTKFNGQRLISYVALGLKNICIREQMKDQPRSRRSRPTRPLTRGRARVTSTPRAPRLRNRNRTRLQTNVRRNRPATPAPAAQPAETSPSAQA